MSLSITSNVTGVSLIICTVGKLTLPPLPPRRTIHSTPPLAYISRTQELQPRISFLGPTTSQHWQSPSTRTTKKRFFTVNIARKMVEYQAIVLGAGPAGIAVVGNLLDQKVKPILWIDDKFAGGRLNEKYREVPANTRVCLFRDFATAVSPLKQVVEETPRPNAYTVLDEMDGEWRCEIGQAADLCQMLINGLDANEGAHKFRGRVSSFRWSDASRKWSVQLPESPDSTNGNSDTTASAKMLVLCHGASPSPPPFPISLPNLTELSLDPALRPSELATIIPRNDHVTIAVVGASHSAILVLRNLYNLASSTHPHLRVKWFTRHALRYAIPQPDGWTLRDNTGLKGVAATFAKDNLEDDKIAHSPGGQYIRKISTTAEKQEEIYSREMPGCTYVIQAIGYTQDPFPKLVMGDGNGNGDGDGGKELDAEELRRYYCSQSGRLRRRSGEAVPGLFGAGIAWPEKITDKLGNVECNVGMWKFMRYLMEVVPGWVEGTLGGGKA